MTSYISKFDRRHPFHLVAIAIAGLLLALSADIGWGQQLDLSTRVVKAAPPFQSEPQAPLVGPPWEYRSAPARLINPLLLTDGTVIFQNNTNPSNWYKLTPDIFGSYVNGTFSQIASLPNGYGPTYFASAVLPDGRVLIEGGEYNGTPCCQNGLQVWTSLGAIYDPVANTWTAVSPPSGNGWINFSPQGSCDGGIGDAASIVLPNGTFLLSAACANPPVDALFNPTNLSWTATGAPSVVQNEPGFTLMQNGKVLMIDTTDPPNAQAYDPESQTWSMIAPTPVAIADTCGTREIGPAVTRPDGTVVAFGGNTCLANPADPTAIYNPSNNTWALGPYVPATCGTNGTTSCSLADAAAVVLPNGNILFSASAGFNQKPSHLFEFTTANTINQVPDDNFATNAFGASYVFLMLPTGQALTTIFCTCLEFYDPSGSPNPAWAPTITSAPVCVAPNSSYVLAGTQLNGLSQGAAYGDDFQSATNYPLIRIVNNATGHVFYTRTSGFSTMSIAPHQAGTTNFKVAAATELGGSMLYVVTNGIPSVRAFVTVDTSCAANARTHDFNGDGKSDIAWRNTNGDTAIWLMTVTSGNAQILSSADYGVIPNSWSIVGQRDFNGDGKADLLWSNTNGDTSIWLMNGTAVTATPDLGFVGNGWSIVGTGDFNGDGFGDILWRNTNGDTSVWLMTGTPTQVSVLAATDLGVVPTSWSVAETGDFNGDGKTDILWHNANGDTSIWLMTVNGTQMQVLSAIDLGVIPTSWAIAGTGDFNADSKSDIVWHNTNGDTSVWLMTGSGTQVQVLSSVDFGVVPTSWNVAFTGDFNGDGKSDILWRNSNGDTSIWFMNGTSVSSTSGVGVVPASWIVQAAGAE